tara:strand:- start:719 stop:1534 length:816 start_codon:yes stop_codon:yes gene_type:complete
MTNFNLKVKVRKAKNQQKTLDHFHNKKLNEFSTEKKNIEKYQKTINNYEKELNILNKINPKKLTDQQFEQKFDLIEKINNLKDKIKKINSNDTEHDYFLDVGDLLYEYYDKDDNKDKISQNSIINFFNKNNTNTDNNSSFSSIKAELLDNYLSTLDNKYKKSQFDNQTEYCDYCENQLKLNYMEGINVCDCCGEQYFILIDSDKPNYKEPTNESTYFAYKRINHYNEYKRIILHILFKNKLFYNKLYISHNIIKIIQFIYTNFNIKYLINK